MQFQHLVDAYISDRSPVVVDGGKGITRSIRDLKRAWADRDINIIGQIDFDDRASYITSRGAKLGTARQELNIARAALNYGARQGYRGPVPKLQLPATTPTKMRILTESEAALLVRYALDPEILNFIVIGLITGARIAAISELTWRNVDFERGVIDFRSQRPYAERQKGRPVFPMTSELSKHLASYRELTQPAPETRVCRWGPMKCYCSFRQTVARAKLGIDVTPNTLRHTAAVNMIRTGPVIFASRALGHRNLATTEAIYSHVLSEELRPAAIALNELLTL